MYELALFFKNVTRDLETEIPPQPRHRKRDNVGYRNVFRRSLATKHTASPLSKKFYTFPEFKKKNIVFLQQTRTQLQAHARNNSSESIVLALYGRHIYGCIRIHTKKGTWRAKLDSEVSITDFVEKFKRDQEQKKVPEGQKFDSEVLIDFA